MLTSDMWNCWEGKRKNEYNELKNQENEKRDASKIDRKLLFVYRFTIEETKWQIYNKQMVATKISNILCSFLHNSVPNWTLNK